MDAHYESVTRRIFEQRDGLAHVILDARHLEVPNLRLVIRTDQPPISGGTLEELAVQIGATPAALDETVRAYNAACVPGPWNLPGRMRRAMAPWPERCASGTRASATWTAHRSIAPPSRAMPGRCCQQAGR
ncbi:hypothetical protein [Roseicella sp. DB1501]|uniref:hypothetical protein n=1 Tax=Roseicella sp. DB1501 TaxID=2730925 RepID=UPI0014928D64|nr:hypothetical protein [Roseicella sp. DB1501]NOG72754.1 hypothetical protein [Roseicella sp. DB1501]